MPLNRLHEKLVQFEKDLDKTQQKIKGLIKKQQQTPSTNHVYCYFNHSLMLEHEKDNSRLIIGSFHIKNATNKVKKAPIILIKLTSESNFNFLGKFQTINQQSTKGFKWKRMNLKNLNPKNHFCLKPIGTDSIAPNELLSFQNFQIKIPIDASILVEGFVYFDESNDGVPAINTINIEL